MHRSAVAAVLLGMLLTVSACGEDEPTETAAEPTADVTSSQPTSEPATTPEEQESAVAGATLAVEVSGDDVSPSGKTIEMAVGDVLTIRVVSDRTGELHIHSSPEQYMDFKAGTTRRDISIDKPGQVDIEEHDSGALIARLLVQ